MAMPVLNYESAHGADKQQTAERAPASGSRGSAKPPRAAAESKTQKPIQPAEARARAVYAAVERILDSQIDSEAELSRTVAPFSGSELLQAAEERALAGVCGRPTCRNRLPPKGGLERLKTRVKQGDGISATSEAFCSSACELGVRRLASRLGTPEAAMARFLSSADGAQSSQSHSPVASHPPRQQPLYAAGGSKTPIMLAQIQRLTPTSKVLGIPSDHSFRTSPAKVLAKCVAPHHTASSQLTERAVQERTPDTAEVPSTSGQQASEAAPGTAGAVEGYVTRRGPWLLDSKTAAEEASRPGSSSGRQHALSSADRKQLGQVAEASAQQEKRARFAPTAATRQAQVEEVGAKRPTSRRTSDSVVKDTVQERALLANGAHQALKPQNLGSATGAAPHAEQQLENGAARQQTVVLGFGDSSGGTTPGCPTHSGAAEQPTAVLVFEVEDPSSVLDGAQADLQQRFGTLRVADPADLGLTADALRHLPAADPTAAARPERLPDGQLEHLAPLTKRDLDELSEQELFEPEAIQFAAAGREYSSDESEPLEDEAEAMYGSSVGTWLEEPEEGYALQLSTFGQVHSTLESVVTDRTVAFCAGQTVNQAPAQDARHLQVLHALQQAVARGLTSELLRSLAVSVPRAMLDPALLQLLRTFNLNVALPSMRGASWSVLVIVLLKALSMEQLPVLRQAFEGADANLRLSTALQKYGLQLDHFVALLEVILMSG